MEATKRTHGKTIVKKVEETLDAELWGKLQDQIPLHVLYEKLPLKHRLRLRIVCKAWYHSSLQRLEPKPYFVTIAADHSRAPDGLYLNGLVKYDVASQKFSFRRQSLSPYRMDGYTSFPPFAVEGLIFCDNPGDECGVFSIHTKTWHRVPLNPELYYPNSVCGMMVDTSKRPYTFKLIMGGLERKTQIYDSRSRSWCTTSSVLSQTIQEWHDKVGSFSCMCHDGCVYMSLGQEMVLVYSMEEDSWTTLNFPPLNKEGNHNTLGVWDGRIFTARGNYEELHVSLWELVDPKKQEWVEYARCAEDEFHWLMFFSAEMQSAMGLVSVFCDEYALVYNWQYNYNRALALVMFNMKTKKCEPVVQLPLGTVSIEKKNEMFYQFGDDGMESDYEVGWTTLTRLMKTMLTRLTMMTFFDDAGAVHDVGHVGDADWKS